MTSQRVERTWIRTGGSGANGLIILRNTATPDTEKHMGAEEPLHFLTKTDLANHKKRKITETETGMET